jgi:parallel beta-helix repeat protein
MLNCSKLSGLLLGLAVTATGVTASAQAIKVPKDFGTIQEAVDAAVSGDVITVSSGTYVENIFIGPSLDGLTIQGKGKVMVDGQMGAPGILIGSSNVTLKGLTLRHANGIGVSATLLTAEGGVALTGIVLDKLTIINSQSSAIDLNVDGALITDCKAMGCDGGIRVTGAGAQITKSEVHNDGDNGILVTGAGAQVTRCTVAIIEDEAGIRVNGNAALVDRNTVSGTCGNLIDVFGLNAVVTRNNLANGDSDGIVVSGDSALVDRNDVHGVCGDLINVVGNNVTVTSNKVMLAGGGGISVEGSLPTVSKNTVEDTGDDEDGIEVSSETLGGTVEQNRVKYAFSHGYDLGLSGATIRNNQATKCGAEGEGGFDIEGDDNTIDGNKAMDCVSNGFRIRGSTNTVTKNQAKDNIENGILIQSDAIKGEGAQISLSNNLVNNTCTGNQGQGLYNQGVGTIIEKNKLSKNRQDLANRTSGGASLVDQGGNKFTTGGLMTEAEIDFGN